MIWLAWRQFRAQTLVVAVLVLVFSAVVAFAPRSVRCPESPVGACGVTLHYAATAVLLVLPVLLGVFWGAPLVAREIETGTYRLILTQSIGRRRWLLVKLALGGGAATLSAGLISLVLTRWADPFDRGEASRVTPLVFQARGIVPVVSAVLAFVLGVVVGQLLRRTLTAMTVTLLVAAALQVAVPTALMSVLTRPVTTVTALDVNDKLILSADPVTHTPQLDGAVQIPDAWIMSRRTVTPGGALFTGPVDATRCDATRPTDPPSAECRAWLATQHLGIEVTYVPGSRFWSLQWRTFGVLLLLTLALCWFSLWRIERRLA
jgi:hypothetical protein